MLPSLGDQGCLARVLPEQMPALDGLGPKIGFIVPVGGKGMGHPLHHVNAQGGRGRNLG